MGRDVVHEALEIDRSGGACIDGGGDPGREAERVYINRVGVHARVGMDVKIDQAGRNDKTIRVDDRSRIPAIKIWCDRCNGSVQDRYVCDPIEI